MMINSTYPHRLPWGSQSLAWHHLERTRPKVRQPDSSMIWWIQWSRVPWTKFITMDCQVTNLANFGPIFFPTLVTIPRNNIYITRPFFVPLLCCCKACACWPKNAQCEPGWITPFGIFCHAFVTNVTRFSHMRATASAHLWFINIHHICVLILLLLLLLLLLSATIILSGPLTP